jgi:Tfp pilus assembly protein PilF
MNRIEKILEFLSQQPQDNFLRHALALEYIKIGNEQLALEQFLSLLTDNPHYVGSYYHLGKLYERVGENEKAISTYEKGMVEAKNAKDNHSYNELMMAKEDLE